MIELVMENCQKTGHDWAVVTDDDRIEAKVQEVGGKSVRVDDDVATGSERIALAYTRFFDQKKYDFVVNVQGDEPLLDAESIKKLVSAHENNLFDIYTAVRKRVMCETDFHNPNVVKCVKSEINQQCLYFSRAPIPYGSEKKDQHWFQHVGLYSYRAQSLLKFVGLAGSPLESQEKLEQLRALENGMTIGALELNVNLIGVDTPDDVKRVEEVLGG